MHKGVILLTKADGQKGALNNAHEFLAKHQDKVWDWYQIGGRWARALNPCDKEFNKRAKEFCLAIQEKEKPDTPKHETIYDSTVKAHDEELQQIWDGLVREWAGQNNQQLRIYAATLLINGRGRHPWSDQYELPKDGTPDDVMPLAGCLEIVKEWLQDPKKQYEEMAKYAERWKEKSRDALGMYKYAMTAARKVKAQKFCFDTNVFNIETKKYAIPENPDGWYAVMVDMHN